MNKITVTFPKNFKNKVNPLELINLRYNLVQIAVNKNDGRQLWLVESFTNEGIQEFNNDYDEFVEIAEDLIYSSEWQQLAFPNINETNPVLSYNKGIELSNKLNTEKQQGMIEISKEENNDDNNN